MQSILIVSNNENLISGLQNQILQGTDNIELKKASSIPEAIQKIKENQFDVVISEFQTSAIDGSELQKSLNEKGIKVPFIMLLDNVQKKFYSQALNLGVDYCISNHDDLEIFKCEIYHIIQKLYYQISLEKTLKESENRYYSQVEQSLKAVTIIQNDRIVYSNPAAEKLLDYTNEEFLSFSSEDFIKLIHPKDLDFVLKRIQSRLDGKLVPSRYECRLINKSGDIRWVDLFSSTVEFNGQPAIQTTSIDITDRKQKEIEIQMSEQKYRFLFDNVPVGIGIADLEGKILSVNQRMCELMNHSYEEFLSLYTNDLYFDPSSRQKIFDLLKENGSISNIDIILKKKDSSHLQTSLNIDLTVIDGKQVVIVSLRDVTELKKVEKSLQESEAKYRYLVEQANDGIVIVEGNEIVLLNPQFANMLGYTVEELINSSYERVIHPDAIEEIKERRQARLDGKPVPSIYESKLLKKDGKPLAVELNVGLIDFQEKPSFLSFIRDITERKQRELEIAREKYLSESLINEMPYVAMLLKPITREIIASNKHAVEVGAIPGMKCYETWTQRQNPCPWCLLPKACDTGKA